MIRRRLALRFILQLALVGGIVLVLTAATFVVIAIKMDEAELSIEFTSSGLQKLVETSVIGEDGIAFDPKLLEKIIRQDGWLQTLDTDGQVEFAYQVPDDVPARYKPGELVAYSTGENPFPYTLYLWIQEKHGKLITLVYGTPKDIDPVLEQLKQRSMPAEPASFKLPGALTDQLEAMNGYIQLLDASGREVYAYHRPAAVPDRYSVQELALWSRYPERYGYRINSAFDSASGQTWIVGQTYGGRASAGLDPLTIELEKVFLTGMATLLGLLLLLFLALSLWQAHRFGAPMLHMLSWIDRMTQMRYEEPTDRKGVPRSRTSKGRWRRRYRVFSDVMLSLRQLSRSLARERQLRAETEQQREEWIAGVTHDLKTPLASVTGYAHLLTTSGYHWSPEEVRQFSSVILEKATHMDQLITDLEMTYRLKNGVQPPSWSDLEWNGWLTGVVEHARSHPDFQQSVISLDPAREQVIRPIYAPWLERVVYNLIANALLHNPPGTSLTVKLEQRLADDRLILSFIDDGVGMDEVTVERLFERYYRGTATTVATHGSGLGMAVTKGLTEALGGSIHVESAPGKGTTIRLEWR